MESDGLIKDPPKSLKEGLSWLGPGWVFAACMIGTGELILTTRAASVYGWAFLWCIPLVNLCKGVSTISVIRYGTLTGMTFIEGVWKRKWLRWIVPYCMVSSFLYLVGIGAHMGLTAGTLDLLFPETLSSLFWIFLVVVLVVSVGLLGIYEFLEKTMLIFVLLILLGLVAVVFLIPIPLQELVGGLVPQIPADVEGDVALITWVGLWGWLGAGWGPTLSYAWWAKEKGAGMYLLGSDRKDVAELSEEDKRRLKGWLRPVYMDLSVSYLITLLVSSCLYISGATVLFPRGPHPSGIFLVETLSLIFTETLGSWAYHLFLLGSLSLLLSSVIGVVDGLSRATREFVKIILPHVHEKVGAKNLLRVLVIISTAVPLVFLLIVQRPIWLLLLSSLMFAPAIGIIFLSSTYLSLTLPKEFRPSLPTVVITVSTSIVMVAMALWQFTAQFL